MKISEISEIIDIDNDMQDMVDAIKLPLITKIDKLIDNINYISNDYSIPVEFLNNELVIEMLMEAKISRDLLVQHFDLSSKWVFKINQIIHYLSNS